MRQVPRISAVIEAIVAMLLFARVIQEHDEDRRRPKGVGMSAPKKSPGGA